MRRNRWLLGGSVVLVLAAVACEVLTTGFLDKAGRLGSGRVNFAYAPVANGAAGLLLAAPLAPTSRSAPGGGTTAGSRRWASAR